MATGLFKRVPSQLGLTNVSIYLFLGSVERIASPFEASNHSALYSFMKDQDLFPVDEQDRIYGCMKHYDTNFPQFKRLNGQKVKKLDTVRFEHSEFVISEFKGRQARIAFLLLGKTVYCVYGIKKQRDDWPAGQLTQAKNQAFEVLTLLKEKRVHYYD